MFLAARRFLMAEDGRGKYLIPGLWDMHVHSLNTAWIETFFPLFIASGVTGTRDMARPLTDLELFKNRWSKEIAAGSRIGPRVVAAGPSIDGPKRVFPYLSVQTETEGREAVRMLRQHGVDFIKVYSGLPRDIYFAIADEVKKQELSFVGHPPNAVSPIEASDAGQKSFEHLFTVLIGCSKKEDELRKEAVAAMIRADGPNSLAAHAQAEARIC